MRLQEPIVAAPARHDEPGLAGFDLSLYWRLLLKRWPWIALAVALGVAVGIGKYLVSPKLYRASTRIQIEPRSLVSVSKDRNPWLDQWTNMKYFPTQYRLLQSRGLAERVVTHLELDTDPRFGARAEGSDGDNSSVADDRFRAGLARRLLAGLTVDPIEGTELLDIHYVGTDPELTQRIANGFAEAFIEFGVDKRRETLVQASRVLANQIDSLRAEVEELETRIQELGRRGEDGGVDPTIDSAGQGLLQLDQQVAAAMSGALTRQQRYRDLTGTPDEVIAADAGRPAITRLEADLLAYEREYQTGLQTFKPDHPSMVDLRAKLEETRSRHQEAIRAEARAARQAAYNEWQAALRLVESLDARREQAQQENLALNVASLPVANLQMEVSAKRQRLAELVERQSQAELSTGVEADEATRSNVHVIDTALRPTAPFRPSLRQNVSLGSALGLIGGVALVLLFHFLDRTLKTPEEIQSLLGLPVLAVIPDVGAAMGRRYGSGYGSRRSRSSGQKAPVPTAIELLPDAQPRLAVSEAYRSLRTALLLSSAEALSLVTVTSAEAGEGKTATSTNLATVMAQLGKRVLLIDGDLRKPRLHKVFDVSNQAGLVNCLTSGEHPDSLILPTSVAGLHLLASGPHPPNPSELLASERMRKLLSWAKERFDFVIVDSPPVLAVSDAILPGALSDGVVLCLHANRIERETARSCQQQLDLSGVKVLGVVLNRYHPRHSHYYDRRYNYYEAYAESEADSAA